MANLTLKSIATMIADQAAAVQSSAQALIDFSKGSLLLAYAEANASIGAWLQGLVLQVLAVSRLATSTNSDVDTFVNDWGVYRLAATISAGLVTFSRFTPTNAALVPVGTPVQTADGTQSFVVIVDTTNSAWSASSNGYLLPASVSSVTVPVQSTAAGTAANVAAGAVNVMTQAIIGIDYVSNGAAFAGGSNAETDAQLKARFVLYICSLREGTIAAITYAINSLQLGLQCQIIENQNLDGSVHAGFLCIIVDDGSGAPPSSIITAAAAAAGTVRAGGIPAAVAIAIATGVGFDHPTVVANVAAAVAAYVAALPLGGSLNYMMLGGIVAAIAGVTDFSMTINGSTADIVASQQNRVQLSSLTVV